MSALRKTSLDEIRKLTGENDGLNLRYMQVMADLNRTEAALAAKSGEIRVERIPSVQKTTTVFEPDPNLLERNKQMVEELEIALVRPLLSLASRPKFRP